MKRDSAEARFAARAVAVAAVLGGVVLGLVGCAVGPDVASGEDGRIIAQLAEIAPRDSGLRLSEAEGSAPTDDVKYVECWKPSESMLDDATFRVLCRVHYTEGALEDGSAGGAERYRDMICIGDVRNDPVADYCYRWAYYTDMPAFEDRVGYRAG